MRFPGDLCDTNYGLGSGQMRCPMEHLDDVKDSRGDREKKGATAAGLSRGPKAQLTTLKLSEFLPAPGNTLPWTPSPHRPVELRAVPPMPNVRTPMNAGVRHRRANPKGRHPQHDKW